LSDTLNTFKSRFDKFWQHLDVIYDFKGVQTFQTRDTSDPRHFGTSAEVSVRHIGTGAKVSRQLAPMAPKYLDTAAPTCYKY